MKIISPDILDAIHRMKIQLGTNTAVAKRFGVTSKHVGKVLAEEVNYFEDKTWAKIQPALTPYIRLSSAYSLHLTEDEANIVKYLRHNRREMLQLLLKIEDSKNNCYRIAAGGEEHEVKEESPGLPAVAEERAPYKSSRR
ncbi:MAG: hypothetical protein PHH77_09200 [Victivallaceae bacterium]|nr:hypothetical protein [Victivallaceae bacterium]